MLPPPLLEELYQSLQNYPFSLSLDTTTIDPENICALRIRYLKDIKENESSLPMKSFQNKLIGISSYQDFSLDPPNSEIFPRYGTRYNHLNASPQNQMNSTYSGIQNYAPNYSYSGQNVAEHFQFNNPSQYSKNCNYAFKFHQNIPSSTYNYLNPNLNVLPGSKITQNHIQQKQERSEDNTSFKGQEKDFSKITNRGKLFPYSL